MSKGYIKEATYQFSYLYNPRKWPNSWVLQSILQVSSLKSWRRLEVPERSLGGFWHSGCPKNTSWKLHINFNISTFLGSTPSFMCLHDVVMESKMTLVVPNRCLGGFWHVGFDALDTIETLDTLGTLDTLDTYNLEVTHWILQDFQSFWSISFSLSLFPMRVLEGPSPLKKYPTVLYL